VWSRTPFVRGLSRPCPRRRVGALPTAVTSADGLCPCVGGFDAAPRRSEGKRARPSREKSGTFVSLSLNAGGGDEDSYPLRAPCDEGPNLSHRSNPSNPGSTDLLVEMELSYLAPCVE